MLAKCHMPGARILDFGAPVKKGVEGGVDLAPARLAREPQHATIGAGNVPPDSDLAGPSMSD
eukprot:1770248-Pyramimonas_sp.AAC.1